VITFIDTKGAYPGIGVEERGQFFRQRDIVQFYGRMRQDIKKRLKR